MSALVKVVFIVFALAVQTSAEELNWSSLENEITVPHSTILREMHAEKTLLVSGAPGNPYPYTVEAFSAPQMTIWDNGTLNLLEEISHGLRYAFQTKNIFTLAVVGTGTMGMETTLDNLVEIGDTVLIPIIGGWGTQVKGIVSRLGGVPIAPEKPLGSAFTIEEIGELIKKHKPKVVYIVNGESSTGVFQKVEGLGDLCVEHGCFTIVDVCHVVGIQPFFMDKWKIDAVYSNVQKGIGAPVGLAPVSFSQRAMDKIMKRTQPTHSLVNDAKLWHEKNYWNLDPTKPHIYHHSYPVLLYYTLREALSHLGKQGLVNSWNKHHQAQKYLEDKLFKKFPNLEHFVENPSNRLIGALVVNPPSNIKPVLIHEYMLEKHRIDVSMGLFNTTGKVLRFGLLGPNARTEVADQLVDGLKEAFTHFQSK